MRHPHVINEASVEAIDKAPAGESGFRHQRLSRAAGSENLGCSLYALDPGSESWPHHYHTANEEAMYVLEGRGTVRLGDERVSVQPGDYLVFPTGEGGAHRVFNTGEDALRYLCLSTMVEPEVAVYPEQNMIGVFAGAPPGDEKDERTLHRYLQADADVDYWTGER